MFLFVHLRDALDILVWKSRHILALSVSRGKMLTWQAFLIRQGGVSTTQCFSSEDMNGHPVSSAWPNTHPA